MTIIKKNSHRPKKTEAQEEIDETQGQQAGNIISRKGTVAKYNGQVYMVALED